MPYRPDWNLWETWDSIDSSVINSVCAKKDCIWIKKLCYNRQGSSRETTLM